MINRPFKRVEPSLATYNLELITQNLELITYTAPSPLTNLLTPIVPSSDRSSKELTQRVLFPSFSLYEMEIFTYMRRGAYELCDA